MSLFKPDGTQVPGKAEWRWRWILDGMALQDVYTLRSVEKPRESRIIGSGTAIRFLDPGTAQWRVVYISPSRGYLYTFNARENGDQILLEGVDETGAPMRWVFSEIKPQTFRWRALVSPDGGKSWEKRQEMLVQRVVP